MLYFEPVKQTSFSRPPPSPKVQTKPTIEKEPTKVAYLTISDIKFLNYYPYATIYCGGGGVAIVSAQVQWLFVTKFCAHIGSQPHSSHHPEWVPDPPSNHSRRPSGNHKKIYSVTKFKLTRTNKKKHTGGKKNPSFLLTPLQLNLADCKRWRLQGGQCHKRHSVCSLLLQLLFIFPVGFSQSCRHTLMIWGRKGLGQLQAPYGLCKFWFAIKNGLERY